MPMKALGRHVLAAYAEEKTRLTQRLVTEVATELGVPPVANPRHWPVDVGEVLMEFLDCVVTNDIDRVAARGSIFERLGRECARGGVDVDLLVSGLRIAVARCQAQVHRAILGADRQDEDSESVIGLLSRVMTVGEAVVSASQRGHDLADLDDGDEDEALRRLASVLMYGRGDPSDLVAEVGWQPSTKVCAILTSADSGPQIRRRADVKVAYYDRAGDVVLIHPVADGKQSSSLQSLLVGHTCVVGPAVPLDELPGSLTLATRAELLDSSAEGITFADDVLLELAMSADPAVITALQRKHLGEFDFEAEDHPDVLASTLHEWLLQWGHRPGIATSLDVHPQTVSHRIKRIKDWLAYDLEDPRVRAELLVLLTAMSVHNAWQAP